MRRVSEDEKRAVEKTPGEPGAGAQPLPSAPRGYGDDAVAACLSAHGLSAEPPIPP